MATPGLHDGSRTVLGRQCHQDGAIGDVLVPLLQPWETEPNESICDLNIWWRGAKLVYNRERAASPVRGALCGICPVYGICHAYKACVSALYKASSHFFICLEYDCFLLDPTCTRVYQYAPLIVPERLILLCYLAHPAVQSPYHRGFRSFTVDIETSLWKERWEALRELLQDYIPATTEHLPCLAGDHVLVWYATWWLGGGSAGNRTKPVVVQDDGGNHCTRRQSGYNCGCVFCRPLAKIKFPLPVFPVYLCTPRNGK